MNPKGEILRKCGFKGIKRSPVKLYKVGSKFDTWLGVLNSTLWGPNLSCSTRFYPNIRLNSIGWSQSQKPQQVMEDYPNIHPCLILPKKARQPKRKSTIYIQILGCTVCLSFCWLDLCFGFLPITPLSSTIKGRSHQPHKHTQTP